MCSFWSVVLSPSSGIREGFLKYVDRAPNVRQFAQGLCGCGFETRRCLHEGNMLEGIELLLLRLDPSKDKFKHCKRRSVED